MSLAHFNNITCINYGEVIYQWNIDFNNEYHFLLRKTKIELLLNGTKIPSKKDMLEEFKIKNKDKYGCFRNAE